MARQLPVLVLVERGRWRRGLVAELSKEERKARVRELNENELAAAIAGMPLKPQKLRQLINFLDGSLCQAGGCDRTLRFTRSFLSAENVDAEKVIAWLGDNGGGCDCEVVANLDDLSMDVLERSRAPKTPPAPRPPVERKEQGERSLETVTGWDFANLPAPWRVANRYKPQEPLQLEFGKRGRCTLTVFEKALPRGAQESDEYWTKVAQASERRERNSFYREGQYAVAHGELALPDGLRSVTVRSTWGLRFWIVPEEGKWFLEGTSETLRYKTDKPEIEALIRHLTGSAG